jgi:hypothetical protein
MIETPVPDTTNATRDVESEFDAGQEGKIREIVMDNVESEPVVCNNNSFFGLSWITGNMLLYYLQCYC